ncbi:23S rRNA (adenine(2503)-C(2))-methyltransferase RlmN [Candidatus Bipolaricaulota bacterium]|nr:23S rRNA (adenine(2503)-C(2))-methyltransferase RlmN [Candidatus Bipolaricaulota bacterium]
MGQPCLLDLEREDVAAWMREMRQPQFRVNQVWQAVYVELVDTAEQITTLPQALRRELQQAFPACVCAVDAEQVSADLRTKKALLRFADGATVEAVLMTYAHRRTVCVSTQVGCAIGCSFCATGRQGFVRNLSVGEIVSQVLHFARLLHRSPDVETSGGGGRVTNVVFMGMGEPFLNLDATFNAIRRLNDPDGFRLGARSFTVSTAGIVPGIDRLANELPQVNLAVSLHAGSDVLRNVLVPVNRTFPLRELIATCRRYIESTGRRITFEIALIEDVNDSLMHAKEIAALLHGLIAHVNLIPLNPVRGDAFLPSPRKRVAAFADMLRSRGIPTTVRLGRGVGIDAGCGQLRSRRGHPTTAD